MDGSGMDEIAAFLAVLEARSFTGAARMLKRDASITSRRVSALEARLGVRLVERSTRHVAQTAAGSRFNGRMVAASRAMQEAEAEAAQLGTGVTGKLRISLPATFGRFWIAPLLPAFLRSHPGLSLEIEYVDLLAENFDAAVRLGELRDSRFIVKLAPHIHLSACQQM